MSGKQSESGDSQNRGSWWRRHPKAIAAFTILVGGVVLALYWVTRPAAYMELGIRPWDARVEVDGQPVSLEAGWAIVRVSPGRHKIEVAAEGCRRHVQYVDLVRGRENARVVIVDLKSRFGYLYVDSSPSGASVEMLDPYGSVIARGLTPFQSGRIAGGNYALRLSKDLYETVEVQATVPYDDRFAKIPAVKLKAEVEDADSWHRLLGWQDLLDKPIVGTWESSQMPLSEVVKKISASQNVPIQIDVESLAQVGLSRDTPVSFSYSRGSFRSAMRLMLQELELVIAPVDFRQEYFGLQITTREQAEIEGVQVTYPVRDLVVADTPVSEFDYSRLIERITLLVTIESWKDVGGLGTIAAGGDVPTVVIHQSLEIHLQILEYLTELRQVRTAYESTNRNASEPSLLLALRRVRAVLNQPIARPWQFTDTPLGDVCKTIKESDGVSMHLDIRALDIYDIDASTKITFSANSGKFGAAMKTLLEPLDLKILPIDLGDERPQFQITSVEEAIMPILVVYPVADLVEQTGRPDTAADLLVNAVTDTVAPGKWGFQGHVGAIDFNDNEKSLSVSQSFNVQLRLLDFLDKRRERIRNGERIDTGLAFGTGPSLSAGKRRAELDRLKKALQERPPAGVTGPLHKQLVAFIRDNVETPEAWDARKLMSQLSWPIDQLDGNNIPPAKLRLAGGGTIEQAPSDLVAVFGDGRLKHWDAVNVVQFSPNGKTLATAGQDRSIKLWNVETRQLLRTLTGHTEAITSLAYAHDGATLVSGSQDSLVKLWRGKLVSTLRGHSGPVLDVAHHRTENIAASCGEDKTIRIWDTASGEGLRTLAEQSAPVTALTFADGGKTLVSGGKDGKVCTWNWKTGELVGSRPYPFAIRCLAMSPDGATLAIGGDTEGVKLFSVQDGKESTALLREHERQTASSAVRSLAFSPDGKFLLAPLETPVDAWYFSPMRPGVLNKIMVWNIATARIATAKWVDQFPYNRDRQITTLACSPDGKTVAWGDQLGVVQISELTGSLDFGSIATAPRPHQAGVFLATLSLAGEELLTTGANPSKIFWKIGSGEPDDTGISYLWKHEKVAVDRSRRTLLASEGQDVTIWVWGQRWPSRYRQFQGDSAVTALALSSDGSVAASALASGDLILWNTSRGRLMREMKQRACTMLTFSPDRHSLAAANGNSINVWDVATGELRQTLKGDQGEVRSLSFGPRGERLISGGEDGIIVWNAVSGKQLHRVTTSSPAYSVAFNSNGELLAASDGRGRVLLYDSILGTLRRHWELGPPAGIVWHVEFSPEGRHLVTANANGTAYVLRLGKQ